MVATLAAPTITDDQLKRIVPQNRTNPIFGIGTDVSDMNDARSALQKAGLLFSVKKVPLRNPLTRAVLHNQFAVVREDNKAVLGIVEGQYKVVQNTDFFGDIADQFIQDGARIRRCSYLHRNIDVLDSEGEPTGETNPAEIGGQLHMTLTWDIKRTAISVVGDIVGRVAVIRNSHDGTTAAMISYRLMQLACYNGAIVPVPGFSFDWKIMHTESAAQRIAAARKVLSKAPEYFKYAGHALNLLAKEKMSQTVAERLTHLLIDPSQTDPSKMTVGDQAKCEAIMSRFNGAQPRGNAEALRGTAYGWYTGVMDFTDYGENGGLRIKKSAGFNEGQQRFKSSVGGLGHQMKLNAWDVLSTEYELDKRLQEIIANS